MSLFRKGPEHLVADAQRARASGDRETSARLFRKAADMLTESHRTEEAINLLVQEREYEAAAELAELRLDWARSAKLWFRAGRFPLAARALFKQGDTEAAAALLEKCGHLGEAAQIRESQGSLSAAADLYERGGDKENAARVLALGLRTAPSQRAPAVEAEFAANCRRAARLFAEIGQLDRSIKMLRWAGQDAAAADLMAENGRLPEAVELMRSIGKLDGALDLARRVGEPRLIARLRAELAEIDGDCETAIAAYEEAGELAEAARLWAFTGEPRRAALLYERSARYDSAASLYQQAGLIEDAVRCLRLAGRELEAAELMHSGAPILEAKAPVSPNDRIGQAILVLENGPLHPHYAEAQRFLREVPNDSPDFVRVQMALGDTSSRAPVPQVFLGGSLAGPPATLAEDGSQLPRSRVSEPRFQSQAGVRLPSSVASPPTGFPPAPPSAPPVDAQKAPVSRVNESSVINGRPPTAIVDRTRSGNSVIMGMPSAGTTGADAPASASRPTSSEPGATVPPIAQTLVGTVLRGRFRIEKRVGGGAQAQVYQAKDVVLDRSVAIKVLNDSVASDPVATERFLREARFAARVNHQNSIGVFDFGHDGGLTFMAMEYFAGQTLRAYLKSNAPPLNELIRIAIDVAEAIKATHDQDIVHRDVKPSNVMIDGRGQIRLADFGIARNVADDPSSEKGIMMGSLAYMAPEQATGGKLDIRADIFAFGVVVFEMVARRKPFAPTMDALKRRLDHPPPSIPASPKMPQRLATLVERCLQPTRHKRPENMAEVLKELRAIADGLAVGHGLRESASPWDDHNEDVVPTRAPSIEPSLPLSADLPNLEPYEDSIDAPDPGATQDFFSSEAWSGDDADAFSRALPFDRATSEDSAEAAVLPSKGDDSEDPTGNWAAHASVDASAPESMLESYEALPEVPLVDDAEVLEPEDGGFEATVDLLSSPVGIREADVPDHVTTENAPGELLSEVERLEPRTAASAERGGGEAGPATPPSRAVDAAEVALDFSRADTFHGSSELADDSPRDFVDLESSAARDTDDLDGPPKPRGPIKAMLPPLPLEPLTDSIDLDAVGARAPDSDGEPSRPEEEQS